MDRTNGNFTFGVWKYDTLQVGKLTYAARYVPGVTDPYVVQSTGYTSLGKPLGSTIKLPATEAPLPTTYSTTFTYSPTTQKLITQRDPGIAGLLTEDITFSYDKIGNPSGLKGLNAVVGPIEYVNTGELARITYGPSTSPVWSTYSYDGQTRRLLRTETQRTQPAGVVDDLTYTYDGSGNPLSVTDKQSETGSTVT
ncbi:hypothetical protein, partial [Kitasatospora phosalacinea]|uniref:hypothetical protein n=1 Tax=Kitasatospora phosalacinea TaxID=2065 RepID=UPI00131D9BF4